MAQTAAPERPNPFLNRCNLEPSTRLHEVVEPAVSRPELSFRVTIDELLGLIGETVTRIGHGDGPDAALRELWAVLLELEAVVARDPGISLATEDLYAAAAALVAGQSTESEWADVRRWRLLKEADARLRDRLALAQPSKKAQLLGLN